MKSLLKNFCAFGLVYALTANMVPLSAKATTIYGDVDNSGSVNLSDAIILSRYIVGNYRTSDVNMKYADVDKNTVLDTNDAKILLNYIVNNISSLPYSQSGITFNYNIYTVPADEARSYIKYDYWTGSTTNYTLSIPASINSSNPTRANGYDDRILDSSANAQCIVKLVYKKSNGLYYVGTGFIVDDHVIATAAHCLYDMSNNVFYGLDYNIELRDAIGDYVIDVCHPEELHIPVKFLDSSYSEKYDYGLIYVEEDLSQYGKMALGIPTDNFKYTQQTLYVSGFPVTIHIGQPGQTDNYDRYYGSGIVTTNTDDYKIWYTTYTSGGDSGGPVFMEYTLGNETFRSAVGIHTYGTTNGITNYGTRITPQVSRFFYSNPNIG